MPYISPEERKQYALGLELLREALDVTKKGHLTYLVYTLAMEQWQRKGRSYTNISEAIGALEDASHELRRRHLDKYEDEKIKDNGDVT